MPTWHVVTLLGVFVSRRLGSDLVIRSADQAGGGAEY